MMGVGERGDYTVMNLSEKFNRVYLWWIVCASAWYVVFVHRWQGRHFG